MKKGRNLLFMVIVLSIGIVAGVFLGRNLPSNTVHIPLADEQMVTSSTVFIAEALININTATTSQLMDLPGIGETLANRIVEYRNQNGQFHSIDELLQIDGIGQKKLDQIQHLISTGG